MSIASIAPVQVSKQSFQLRPNPSRVIARMMRPGERRIYAVLNRVRALSEERVEALTRQVLEVYGSRHRGMEDILRRYYQVVSERLFDDSDLSEERKLLIGSYFTMEYAVESVALFNPSIVLAPDQTGLPPRHARVVLSLRAVGEGHISSIVFRSAVIDDENNIEWEPDSPYVVQAQVQPDKLYDKHLFSLKLLDMTLTWEKSALEEALRTVGRWVIDGVLERLPNEFTRQQMNEAMEAFRKEIEGHDHVVDEVYTRMEWLARCNYEIRFCGDCGLSERVIFPVSQAESGGIEDARFVHFVDDDGRGTFYATYTAYDGHHILTQFLETHDFLTFKVHTLNGAFAQSKGMALFPRRINGQYAMISRIDGENLYVMFSDNIHFWDHATLLELDRQPWEIMQTGNCGSPIETDAGWLLLTHGVGPMRRYCIGAVLLDRDDPTKILGQLAEPLITPDEDSWEGYVPNVVYTCGALVKDGELIMPYAVSDSSSRVAVVNLEDLLHALTS